MSSKEGFLEKKIQSLERRLTRVEKFVEIRFSASLNEPNCTSGNGLPPSATPRPVHLTRTSEPSLRRKVNGRPKSKASSQRNRLQDITVSDKHRSLIKDCFVKIINTATTLTPSISKSSARASTKEQGSSSPYATRRQKKIEAERLTPAVSVVEIKQEVDENVDVRDEGEEWLAGDGDMDENSKNYFDQNVPVHRDHEYYVNDDEEYFVFPSEVNEPVNPGFDHNSGVQDSKSKRENKSSLTKQLTRRKRLGDGSFTEASELKNQKKATSKNSSTPKKKRRNYNGRFGSLSLTKLSDSKVVSSDPTRGECPVCHSHFIHELLPAHIATHAREKHIKCPHCDKMFWKQETLKKHILTIHDIDNYKRRCRLCGKPIVGNLLHHEQFCIRRAWKNGEEIDPNLIEDIRIRLRRLGRNLELPDKSKEIQVDPNKRKECPTCKKSFALEFYDRHLKSHEKARNWTCSKCSKSYIHKHDLVRHMIHTHENIPTCEFCKNTFGTRNELYLHKIQVCKTKSKRKNTNGNGEQCQGQSSLNCPTEPTPLSKVKLDPDEGNDLEIGNVATKSGEADESADTITNSITTNPPTTSPMYPTTHPNQTFTLPNPPDPHDNETGDFAEDVGHGFPLTVSEETVITAIQEFEAEGVIPDNVAAEEIVIAATDDEIRFDVLK